MSDEGPEDGHTFRISYTSRGSYGVVGQEGHTDAPAFDGPVHVVEVRAWNLRDALTKAAALPFDVLMGEEARKEGGEAVTHEMIHALLHAQHRAHLGLEETPPETCAECAMYAEWAAPLIRVGQELAWDEGLRAAGRSLLELHEAGHWEKPVNPYGPEGT